MYAPAYSAAQAPWSSSAGNASTIITTESAMIIAQATSESLIVPRFVMGALRVRTSMIFALLMQVNQRAEDHNVTMPGATATKRRPREMENA